MGCAVAQYVKWWFRKQRNSVLWIVMLVLLATSRLSRMYFTSRDNRRNSTVSHYYRFKPTFDRARHIRPERGHGPMRNSFLIFTEWVCKVLSFSAITYHCGQKVLKLQFHLPDVCIHVYMFLLLPFFYNPRTPAP